MKLTPNGYRYHARKAWIKANGPIPKGYVVHHMDEDVTNNELSNLQLMSRSDHGKLHNGQVPLDERRRKRNKSAQDWRDKNPDGYKASYTASNKRYVEANYEKVQAYKRTWYLENRERILQKQKASRLNEK